VVVEVISGLQLGNCDKWRWVDWFSGVYRCGEGDGAGKKGEMLEKKMT
jgi:hypothetical protein